MIHIRMCWRPWFLPVQADNLVNCAHRFELPEKQTYSNDHSTICEANSRPASQEIPRLFKVFESSLPCSHQPVNVLFPEPHQCCSFHPIFKTNFCTRLASPLHSGFKSGLFTSGVSGQNFVRISCFSCVPVISYPSYVPRFHWLLACGEEYRLRSY